MTEAKRKSTMVELVEELEKLPQTPEIAGLVAEAKAGEFHDYKNQKYDCGKVALVTKLGLVATLPRTPKEAREPLRDLRLRVIDGEFDEEADEEDKAMMRQHLPQSLWAKFGLEKSL